MPQSQHRSKLNERFFIWTLKGDSLIKKELQHLKRVSFSLLGIFLFLALTCNSYLNADEPTITRENSDKIYQISTIDALLAGIYDSNYTVKELKKNGDFGLGTFNGIDGEMVVLDGNVYQVKSNGLIAKQPDDIGVPFAVVHFFKARQTKSFPAVQSYSKIQEELNKYTQCQNYPCAFKITGTFKNIKTRAAPKAAKPYPTLAEHIGATQKFFTKESVTGTLLGYSFPRYFEKFNVPGYHFHFLSNDLTFGGHVLEVGIVKAKVEMQKLTGFEVSLVQTKEFEKSNLKSEEHALEKVEKDTK